MRDRVSDVTRDLVLVPTGREITQYERFRRELARRLGRVIPHGGRRLVTPGPGIAERTVRRTPSVRTTRFGF